LESIAAAPFAVLRSTIAADAPPSYAAPGTFHVVRRNGAVTAFDPTKIGVALTKAFLAVEGDAAAASRRVHERRTSSRRALPSIGRAGRCPEARPRSRINPRVLHLLNIVTRRLPMEKQPPIFGLVIGIVATGAAAGWTPHAAQAQDRRIEELVVTASATPLERAKVGSAVSVITAVDLDVRGIQYTSDALRHVPGVAVSRSGAFGGPTQVRLRGAEGNHVLVLIDGVEAAQQGGGEFDFSSLLSTGIERIEVLRGPQSGLYGANAMAGVINVLTDSGAGGTAVDLALEAGGFDTRQTSFAARGGSDRIHGAITVAYRESLFNTSEIGTEEDGDENTSLLGRGSVGVSDILTLDGSFRLLDKHTELDGFDFSGGPLQGLSIDANDFSDTDDRQIAGGATWAVREGGWVTRLAGNYFEGGSEGGVDPFGAEATREQVELTSTGALGMGSAAARHFLTGFLQHENETYRNTHPFDPSQVPEQERTTLGLGVEYRGEFNEKVFFSGTVRNDDNDGFEDATTYRATLAYVYGADGSRLHTSYGTGVTNPTFLEQFGFVPGTFVGNPNLEPEEVAGWDAGVEQRFADGRLMLDLTYFDADLENEIVSVFPSIENDDGTSERQGVEVTFSGELADRVNLSAAFTYTDADDPDGSEEVRRPKHTGSVDLTYSTASGRARIYGGVVYNGQMLDDDFRNFFVTFSAAKTELPSYTLVNVGGSYLVADRVEIYGRVDNLFDEEYEDVISYNTPGRAFYAGFRWRIAGGQRTLR
jgi:vitamin B12 transporter